MANAEYWLELTLFSDGYPDSKWEGVIRYSSIISVRRRILAKGEYSILILEGGIKYATTSTYAEVIRMIKKISHSFLKPEPVREPEPVEPSRFEQILKD